MSTPKQMEKMAIEAVRNAATGGPSSGTDMPEEYWQSVLADRRAGARTGVLIQQQRLAEISLHLLRVSCRRCYRIVESQTADAVRLYGAQAIWKDAGRRLLDNGCQNRTGSYEDDGCWPNFELR